MQARFRVHIARTTGKFHVAAGDYIRATAYGDIMTPGRIASAVNAGRVTVKPVRDNQRRQDRRERLQATGR